MAFEWLERFQGETRKDADYTEKTLAAYSLGMRAKGSIVGVVIHRAPDCCDAARNLALGKVYDPADAPRLPLPDCSKGNQCGCVYRPQMAYQQPSVPADK
jgi:hypothetical protein